MRLLAPVRCGIGDVLSVTTPCPVVPAGQVPAHQLSGCAGQHVRPLQLPPSGRLSEDSQVRRWEDGMGWDGVGVGEGVGDWGGGLGG